MEEARSSSSGGQATPPETLSWIVEDDPDAAKAIELLLKAAGSSSRVFSTGAALLDALQSSEASPDIICLDLSLPDISGLELLPSIKQEAPSLPVIVITSNTSEQSIARALELGVYDYLPKTSDRTKFTTTFRRAVEFRRMNDRLTTVTDALKLAPHFGIVGMSPVIRSIVGKISELGPTNVNILISGETGTEKELIAMGLHGISERSRKPFVLLSCSEITENSLESALFGHEPGAFPGAKEKHIGALERAHQGTLFLDQIDKLSPSLQRRLLRAIEERSFFRMGGQDVVTADLRIIASTTCDPIDEVSAGRIRKEFYNLIAVAELHVPPLRSRPGDISLLSHHFVDALNAQLHRKLTLPPETAAVLERYAWPENVLELQRVLQAAFVQCDENIIRPDHLPALIFHTSDSGHSAGSVNRSPVASLQDQERHAIIEALRASTGRISNAAELLGISRATMYRKMKRYGISSRGQF